MGRRQLRENLGAASGRADRCEELFFNRPLVIVQDEEHSAAEERMYGPGQSDAGRFLFVVFTIRARLIRVISARDMSRKERRIYRSS